jgi:hypothetical protein
MMTFVVAAVDDRQIKTGGRTIETRRRLGGCGLRYGPQVSSAEQWLLPPEPNLTAAPLAPAPSAIPATGCYVEARARDTAYEFPSDEFSSAAFAAVGPLDVAGHPTLKLPTPG